MKVYGPYTRKDGRKHVVLYENGKRTTMSYPKWLLLNNGVTITDSETVDHINRDFTDDRLENLQIKERIPHIIEDHLRAKSIIITCVWCGQKAEKSRGDIRGNSKQGKAGPFCSRRCAGTYGAAIQKGWSRFLVQPTVELEYYRREKTVAP